jgi:hypothetical protein
VHYFDYEAVGREAKIPVNKMQELRSLVEREFPNDPLMCELHLLRVCMAIRNGDIDLDDALKSKAEDHL